MPTEGMTQTGLNLLQTCFRLFKHHSETSEDICFIFSKISINIMPRDFRFNKVLIGILRYNIYLMHCSDNTILLIYVFERPCSEKLSLSKVLIPKFRISFLFKSMKFGFRWFMSKSPSSSNISWNADNLCKMTRDFGAVTVPIEKLVHAFCTLKLHQTYNFNHHSNCREVTSLGE